MTPSLFPSLHSALRMFPFRTVTRIFLRTCFQSGVIHREISKGKKAVIRQAISCDVCGTEMLHPNHWFAANDQGPELRVSRWSARTRLRPGTKHLCGQTCLHKLVDEFTARTQNQRTSASADKPPSDKRSPQAAPPRTEKSLAPPKAFPIPALPVIAAAYVGEPCVDNQDEFESSARLLTPLESSTRSNRAEAWKRERERQQQTVEPRTMRRRSIA